VKGEEGHAAAGRRGAVGVVIRTLPVGCRSVRMGNVAYSQCGPTYYRRVGAGYQVVVLR
jgi:hypothetical protein